jgi:hypothetical protein
MTASHMTETDMTLFRVCCQLRDNAAALGMAEKRVAELEQENAVLRKRLEGADQTTPEAPPRKKT